MNPSNKTYHFDPRDYLGIQRSIYSRSRRMLFGWMFHVTIDYKLKPSNYFMAVRYVEKALMRRQIKLREFQAYGVMALFIASYVD